jgi:hypothetical protein
MAVALDGVHSARRSEDEGGHASVQYEEPPWCGRLLAIAAIETGGDDANGAVIALAMNDDDGPFVERYLNELICKSDVSPSIKEVALIGLGHVARRFRRVFCHETQELLRSLLTDPRLGGVSSDALSDIRIFAGSQGRGPSSS